MGNDGADKIVVPSRCPRCDQDSVAVVPYKHILRCYNPDCGGDEPAFEIPEALVMRANWIRYSHERPVGERPIDV